MAALTTPELDPEVVERKRKLAFAKVKYGVWIGTSVVVFFVVIMPLTSEAARTIFPFFGTKLSKAPVIGPLFSGQSMAKVDIAYVVAGIIYVVVLYFWRELLFLWLVPDASSGFNEGPYRTVVTLSSILVLIIDGILVYVAVAALNWGTVTFSFVALLFTLTYLVGLVFASLVSMRLKKEIKQLEEEL